MIKTDGLNQRSSRMQLLLSSVMVASCRKCTETKASLSTKPQPSSMEATNLQRLKTRTRSHCPMRKQEDLPTKENNDIIVNF